MHPHFVSAPDSNLAVLKLKDKAKISEYVLPVCLPEIQGGEVVAQEAYTSRWMLPNDHMLPGRSNPVGVLRPVDLGDITHCEKTVAEGRANTAPISDNTLCFISKPSSRQSPCPRFVPGITTTPAVLSSSSGVLSENHETSAARWQLLGLESSIDEERSCQQSYTIQTKIANFRNWIMENIK